MKTLTTLLRPAISLFLLLTVITGLAYPLITTGIGQVFFNEQANGSLIKHQDKIVGSSLIGQQFTSPHYFWSRPSATSPQPYNGVNSGGSNLAQSNPTQRQAVAERVAALQAADNANQTPIPIDLVTASGSGLDPHISPAAALYQVNRIAELRHIDPETLRQLVAQHTEQAQWGMLGDARVNVLQLNLALDALQRQ